MNSKSCLNKVFSRGTLTGMAALFLLSLGTTAFAAGPEMNIQAQQTMKITGTVVDATGEPVIGATVMQKGTNNGTVTDMDGRYTIDVPANAILVISYIGYTTQEVAASNGANVTLREDNHSLEEVVVTAMGIERKAKSLTYATQRVNGDELTRNKETNLINSLQGKTSGEVLRT